MVGIQTLALFAPSVCHAALSKVCASDADYDGSLLVTLEGHDGCLKLKQWWHPCSGDMGGGRRLPEAVFAEQASPSGGDMDEKPATTSTTAPLDYASRTCDEWAAMVEDDALQQTCFDSLILNVDPWGWYPVVRREWLAMLQPCCGNAPHACAEHIVNPCDDATKFKPKAYADKEGNTCAMAAYALSQLGTFDTRQALCASKVTWGANKSDSAVHSFVEQIANPCCGGHPTICSDFDPGASAAAPRSVAPLLALFALAVASRH